MEGVSAGAYSTNYFQRLTLESWYTNLQQMPLNRCQQVLTPYKQLIQDKNETDKRPSNRRILLIIERLKPTSKDDKLCTSIPANTIKAHFSTDKHYMLPPEAFYSQKITPARLACLCFFIGTQRRERRKESLWSRPLGSSLSYHQLLTIVSDWRIFLIAQRVI